MDLREAVAWIARDDRGAADRLRLAANRAAVLIGQHAELGHVRPELAPERFRFYVLRAFPYVLVYETGLTPPRILRVLHGARELAPLLADLSEL